MRLLASWAAGEYGEYGERGDSGEAPRQAEAPADREQRAE
jgi:hypothetical protein